tara:strand:- start:1261 stop:1617 length:357 start_codon:yes stop_codon:yes gene_type:complete
MSIQLQMKNLTLAKTDTELLEMLQNNIQCIYDKFVSEKNYSIDLFHKEVQEIIKGKIRYDKAYSIDKILNDFSDSDIRPNYDSESDESSLESINISESEINNEEDSDNTDSTYNQFNG